MDEIAELKGDIINTKYETDHIEWIIPDFPVNEDFCYKSPTFFTLSHSWNLRLSPDCRVPNEIEYFVIDIWNEVQVECIVEYSFGLKTIDSSVENLANGCLQIGWSCSNWECLISKSELVCRKAELMPSNTLTITCTLKRMVLKPIELNQIKSLKLTRLDKLSANFKNLFNDKESSDITLKVQEKEFKAHKSVLIARSNVFAATFKHDTLERQTGIITILDCDSDTFQEFLEYLYSGELEELSYSRALNLYYTANKYDVEELKEFCIDCLKRGLIVETICETVVFAEKYEENELFSEVQKFFNKNYIKILLTPEWKYLLENNLQLADKLLTEMAKSKQEE